MTIGIAVLCSSKPKPHRPRPDSIVMIADTMGSTDTDSTSELHKMYVEDNLFAVCAGRVEMAAEVISILQENLSKLTRRSRGDIWVALNDAVHGHRMEHFRWDVVATKHSFMPGAVLESQHAKIIEDWASYDVGLHLIVGVFDDLRMAHIFHVGNSYDEHGQMLPGLVHGHAFPGYWAIGTGAYNANFWLNFRQQQLGLNPTQSTYHAYEAKVMASAAPTVNSNLDLLIAFPDCHYLLTEENPASDGCPVSIPELKSMFKKYGPQRTNSLGHARLGMVKKNNQSKVSSDIGGQFKE